VPETAPVPFDSVELTWAAATDAAGEPLADVSYIVEVLGPGGEWGVADIVRDTSFRMDGLEIGLWSFRVSTLVAGVAGPPSAVLTKDTTPPPMPDEPADTNWTPRK
jgi:hypothetical protein